MPEDGSSASFRNVIFLNLGDVKSPKKEMVTVSYTPSPSPIVLKARVLFAG